MKFHAVIINALSDHGTDITAYNGDDAILQYGDVVILHGVQTQHEIGMPSVTLAPLTATSVFGVVSSPKGIQPGGVGEIRVEGIAEVNVDTAVYNAVNQSIVLSNVVAGRGMAGTHVAGKTLGWSMMAYGIVPVSRIFVYLHKTFPVGENSLEQNFGTPRNINADASVIATNLWIDADCSLGNVTLSLCAIADIPAGRAFLISKIDSSNNALIVVDPLGNTIDGESELRLTMQFQRVMIAHNNTNWRILSM